MIDPARPVHAGEELGLAKTWALHFCGYAARSLGRPSHIAAVMYQLRAFDWQVDQADVIEGYRNRCLEYLHACAQQLWSPLQPLDLTAVASCVVARGQRHSRSRLNAVYSLRAALVMRCEPYAMLVDPGIMKPGCDVALRGPESALKDKIEAVILPPLPPWT